MDVSDIPHEARRIPHNGEQAIFPRPLTLFERDALLWLLPAKKPGYNAYRKYISLWTVVGEGRRGTGNYILADASVIPDTESPLPQVFAYGVIETDAANISVTLRELFEDQLEFEIVSVQGDMIPGRYTEKRRWNFSEWAPNDACPMCGNPPREVAIRRENGIGATLAVCVNDKRLWISDEGDGVNHPIPVTNFHNSIMLHKNIRDPERALAAANFFRDLHTFSDADLTAAFVHYNKLRRKVDLGAVAVPRAKGLTLLEKAFSLFRK